MLSRWNLLKLVLSSDELTHKSYKLKLFYIKKILCCFFLFACFVFAGSVEEKQHRVSQPKPEEKQTPGTEQHMISNHLPVLIHDYSRHLKNISELQQVEQRLSLRNTCATIASTQICKKKKKKVLNFPTKWRQ